MNEPPPYPRVQMAVIVVEFSKQGIIVSLLGDDDLKKEIAYFSIESLSDKARIHKANHFAVKWAEEHGIEAIPLYDCYGCLNQNTEYYMIHDELWFEVATYGRRGMLCFDCLVRRLGRSLTQDDLIRAPVNNRLLQKDSPFVVHPYKSRAAFLGS